MDIEGRSYMFITPGVKGLFKRTTGLTYLTIIVVPKGDTSTQTWHHAIIYT